MRVLVIESDALLGDLLTDLLADEGHTVDGVTTMDEGLARVRAEPWDACVTDGFWPEVVVETRAYLADLASRCPVVLLSARDWARHARPPDLGVAAVVPKPFDLDDFLGALATVTSRSPAG
jgi:DNA-binding response OmpR family regulator